MHAPRGRERFDEARLINIANGLTALRVLLVPLFAYLMIEGKEPGALVVFGLCGLSDALDGLLARRLRQRTLVGAFLDPIADKLLMATAFIVLSYVKIVPFWLAVLVISRDLFILAGSSLYLVLLDASDIQPTALSKVNTGVQILTVVYFLAIAAFPAEFAPVIRGPWSFLTAGILAACAVTTAVSGVQYLFRGIRRLSGE
jgi:cardiolipin synthase (CMP-forming)